MKEEMMTTGFTGGDTATGPTAGFDPKMKLRAKLKDLKGLVAPGNTLSTSNKKKVKSEDYNYEATDYHRGQGEKIQKRTKKWMEKKGQEGAPGLNAMKARTAEHKAKRGVKEEMEIDEATRLKKEKGYDKGGTKKPSGKKDAALSFVLDKIRKEHGKGAVVGQGSKQQKKVKGAKSSAGTGKYLKRAKAKAQTAADAKKRGFKSSQDYVNTMARYGGKDNYDKGRGLGT